MTENTVCVHGLGYIGLPTAAMLANHNYEVTGFDTNNEVVESLRNGDIPVEEPGLRAFVTHALESGNLTVANEVPTAKYHLICVPTPFDDDEKVADLTYVEAAAETVATVLRDRDTVILESTVPPRTTVEVVEPVLEGSGLQAGSDFALVYCPETVLPGNIITELQENDRIVGGVNGVSTEAAVRMYQSFVEGEIRTTDATTAEFVKLIQNTFRDTNIALANEIAKIAQDYDIQSRDAIELANRHPRVDIHHPGPGVGGHCLPIDPWFLSQQSASTALVELSRNINDGMVAHVADHVEAFLRRGKGGDVAILGVAYKGDVDDFRRSPGLALADELTARDVVGEIALTDPHVDSPALNLVNLEDALTGASVTVIITDHTAYQELDPESVRELMAGDGVLDTRAILEPDTWKEAGFEYWRL